MSSNFHVNDAGSTLGAGLKIAALVAVVGVVALAAGREAVVPDDKVAVEQASGPAPAAVDPATTETLMARYGLVAPGPASTRDPSVPADADVIATARDEAPAPTF